MRCWAAWSFRRGLDALLVGLALLRGERMAVVFHLLLEVSLRRLHHVEEGVVVGGHVVIVVLEGGVVVAVGGELVVDGGGDEELGVLGVEGGGQEGQGKCNAQRTPRKGRDGRRGKRGVVPVGHGLLDARGAGRVRFVSERFR